MNLLTVSEWLLWFQHNRHKCIKPDCHNDVYWKLSIASCTFDMHDASAFKVIGCHYSERLFTDLIFQ
jgi:hypothetical protein